MYLPGGSFKPSGDVNNPGIGPRADPNKLKNENRVKMGTPMQPPIMGGAPKQFNEMPRPGMGGIIGGMPDMRAPMGPAKGGLKNPRMQAGEVNPGGQMMPNMGPPPDILQQLFNRFTNKPLSGGQKPGMRNPNANPAFRMR